MKINDKPRKKIECMPVIFSNLQSNNVSLYESIKCYVVFFISLFYFKYCDFMSFNKKELVSKSFCVSNISRYPSRQIYITDSFPKGGVRYYSSFTLRSDSKLNLKDIKQSDLDNKNKSTSLRETRRNLNSPESRPYLDLYKGRGKPLPTPI